MSVQVASSSVVVLGGTGVGVAGEDLGVAERDAGIERVGDRCVTQRVRADVPRDAGSFRDPGDHALGVAAIDRLPGHRAQDQRPRAALAAAGLHDPEHRHGQRHGGGLVALAHQVQHPVAAESSLLSPRSAPQLLRRRAAR